MKKSEHYDFIKINILFKSSVNKDVLLIIHNDIKYCKHVLLCIQFKPFIVSYHFEVVTLMISIMQTEEDVTWKLSQYHISNCYRISILLSKYLTFKHSL